MMITDYVALIRQVFLPIILLNFEACYLKLY